MKDKQYNYLIGKNKKQIIKEFGDEFNYYHSKIWTYELKNTWWGGHKILFIFFDENEATCTEVKKSYFRYLKFKALL